MTQPPEQNMFAGLPPDKQPWAGDPAHDPRKQFPQPSEGKIRNAVAVLRSRFARPDNWHEAAWDVHLREVAKLVLFIGMVGKDG